MNFNYSEDQNIFVNSLEKLLNDRCGPEARSTLLEQDLDYDRALWQSCAEMGFLGLTFPEEYGGFNGSSIDAMVASIEFGKNLAYLPFISSIILGAGALRIAGDDKQKQDLLPGIADGKLTLAVAFTEPDSRFDLSDIATSGNSDGDGYRLNGRKAVVFGGAEADLLIVSARTSGEDLCSFDGISLFIVDGDTQGVEKTPYRMLNGQKAADISFNNVKVSRDQLLGAPDCAYTVIEHVVDLGTAAICAETLGALEKINELTLEYLKQRHQFGRSIGSFQVLQHHMVDMLIEYEHARSLVYEACMKADSDNAAERGRAVSAAKAFIAEKGRIICQKAMQMHGGIGITQEYELSEYVKRVTMAEFAFGDVDHHLIRFADLDD